jgi:hypothetical protein
MGTLVWTPIFWLLNLEEFNLKDQGRVRWDDISHALVFLVLQHGLSRQTSSTQSMGGNDESVQ